ncbi:hypothetical protein V5799_009735 [Amblyomma americanum]|uniref:Uncharacterized protein n=1 Tax=Amblyomma americanum TaxID=6943 RepID=A0AAQ4FBE2_AMBAM
MSLDSGIKRKRSPHVDECEQFQGDSMTSTSDEFQRFYCSSTSDESGWRNDCVNGRDLFEADHGHSAYENSGSSPTPDMDRGRPFQGNWHPSLGPAWSPNLKPMQPSETGRGPQWRSAFMGGTCVVQPENPFILGQGGSYRTCFPGQSPYSQTGWTPHSGGALYNRRVPLQASVATRTGQRVISDREIAQAEVDGEPELTCGGTQILEDASLSSQNRLQVHSLDSGALGTLFASPDNERLFHGGTTYRLSKEESSPPIRQSDTAVYVEVVNAGNNFAPEDFRECRSDALVQPSSYDRDACVQVHHGSGDSQRKEMNASFSVNDQRPNGTEGKAVATIADTDAERTGNSGRAAPFPDPLATIIGPAKDVNAMSSNWLQSSFPAEGSVSSMLVGDERQTTQAPDRFAETTEEPCSSADAAPTKELSFWERETECIASTDAPAVELSFSQPETMPVPSTDAPAEESNLWERETESMESIDAPAVELSFSQPVTTPVTSTDAPAAESNLWERETESMASTDAPAVEMSLSQPETTPVASTDAPAAESNLWERETESMASTDAPAMEPSFSQPETTPVASKDAAAAESNLWERETESMECTDAPAVELSLSQPETTPVASTDPPAAESNLWERETESMASTDAPAMELSFSQPETTPVASTDAPAAESNLWERETESMASTDAPAVELSFSQPETSPVASTDAPAAASNLWERETVYGTHSFWRPW